MPAKDFHNSDKNNVYSYVHNSGVEHNLIFRDKQDYQVFIQYLAEYLSQPADPKTLKTSFTVNGRTFHGTPHLPKNYFDKVELIAFGLFPDQYHLILNELAPGSLARLLRSLCTRYSMYFNKKYAHRGAVFGGHYKASKISDLSQLSTISSRLHIDNDGMPNEYSSYSDFTQAEKRPWVKPQAILSKVENYQEFIKLQPKIPIVKEAKISHNHRIPAFMGITSFMFVVLFSFGLTNVSSSSASEPAPAVAGVQISVESPVPYSTPKPIEPVIAEPVEVIVIRTTDGSKMINLRQEPNTSAEIVGSAQNGDTFKMVDSLNGWYKIDINDGYAYVSSKYAVIERQEN